jgi:hypothetical protein
MGLTEWLPPAKKTPSDIHDGQTTLAPLHRAVGAALSNWEHLESGLTRLFQLLCETPSLAACRAYGTVESCYNKAQMLRAAAEVFFDTRQPFDEKHSGEIKDLISAYEKGQELRNNIAHGMVIGYTHIPIRNRVAYFLCPPSGATKKRRRGNRHYFENIKYFYDVPDIEFCGDRFASILEETMRLISSINRKYSVLTNEQFHP